MKTFDAVRIIGFLILPLGVALFCSSILGAREEDPYMVQREQMVETQIIRRGVSDRKVLDALRKDVHELKTGLKVHSAWWGAMGAALVMIASYFLPMFLGGCA